MEHFQKHENKAVNTFIAKTVTTFSVLSMLKKPGYLNLTYIFVMQVHFTHIETDSYLLFVITFLISSAIRLLATDRSSYFPSPLEDASSPPLSPPLQFLLGYRK